MHVSNVQMMKTKLMVMGMCLLLMFKSTWGGGGGKGRIKTLQIGAAFDAHLCSQGLDSTRPLINCSTPNSNKSFVGLRQGHWV